MTPQRDNIFEEHKYIRAEALNLSATVTFSNEIQIYTIISVR
jgi:hypothetical protein